ncbi:hypothetical protein CB1_001533037 [Camelus ferus]|nr:hypothetical protein CB1_001533037 [Camelus ferus]
MSIDSTNRVDGLALALAPASSKVGTPSPMWWGLARLGQRLHFTSSELQGTFRDTCISQATPGVEPGPHVTSQLGAPTLNIILLASSFAAFAPPWGDGSCHGMQLLTN